MDTIALLQKTPKRALVDIVNFHNNTTLEYNEIEVSAPTVIDNSRKTQVVLDAPQRVHPAHQPRYFGQTTFQFNRLDLEQFFSPVELDVSLTFPATTFDILTLLEDRFGLVFDEQDFIIEEIEETSEGIYTLKAHPDSLRWIGTIDIPFVITEHLDNVLDVVYLDGLGYLEPTTPLESLYRVVALNGLSYDDFGVNIDGILMKKTLDVLWTADYYYEPIYNVDTSNDSKTMLLNALNNVSIWWLDLNQLDFGVPEFYQNVNLSRDNRNTKLVINTNNINGINGSTTIYYNRILIDDFVGESTEIAVTSLPSDTNEALLQFNQAKGTALTNNDVEVIDQGSGVYSFNARAKSLAWVSSVEITFTTS